MVEDLLERLAVEQRLLDRDARFAGHPLADFEVRLVDLREPGVDDLLVQLVLLLEAEHLRRLLGEDVHDPVEHGVVQVGVVDGDGFDFLAERLAQLDRRHQRAERLRAAVDPDEDRVALRLARFGHVLDHPDVAVALARHALADRADDAVAGAADPERADHHEVVRRALEVLEDFDVVFPVHHPRLELHARLAAQARHAVEVTVGDQLQAPW